MHGLGDHALEANDVAAMRVFQEPQITFLVLWRQTTDFGEHVVGGLTCRENGAVGPTDLVERVEWFDVDICVKVSPAYRPKVAEHLRHRDNGRSKIKPVSILMDGGTTPACTVQPIKKRDMPAFRPEAHSRRKTAQTGANHDGPIPGYRI